MNLKIQHNIDLFPYTTLRMRVKAKHFFVARSREDLIEAQRYAIQNKLQLIILGGGSNIAITSHEVDALVVKNVYIKKEIVTKISEYVDLSVSSGYPVTKIVNETTEAGYEGLEYHLGLPGTVGGAIYMNSKWTNPECYFGDSLYQAILLDKNGKIKTVNRDYFRFAYDYSILHETKEILLEIIFRMKKNEPLILKKRAHDAREYRKKTQPEGAKSSGCFFQNISESEMKQIGESTQSAGNLIDKSGLKNFRVGDFVVSPDHANFILNQGEGKPEDLAKIMNIVKEKVKEKFGVSLKEEVIVI